MSQKQLVYLEDDQALAKVTIRALEKRGFRIKHLDSIHSFSSWIESHGQGVFSHALLDLRLDDGNSLSVIADLLDSFPDIKIVILTGYSSIATTVKAMKLGATNYLAKPATVEEIIKAFEDTEADEDDDHSEARQLSLKRLEWEHIQRVLAENDGNISATARQLNMHRRTLQRKLDKKPVKLG